MPTGVYERTPEARANISAALKGRKVAPEALANMIAASRRPEVRAKLSLREAHLGENNAMHRSEVAAKVHTAATFAKAAATKRAKCTAPVYRTVHSRLVKDRGSASSFSCVDCGVQAREWSFSHDTPEEFCRLDPKTESPFSVRAEDYDPRCKGCHISYDCSNGQGRWPQYA